jgi:hypothetical protein
MLALAGVDVHSERLNRSKREREPEDHVVVPSTTRTRTRVIAPLVIGARDLKERLSGVRAIMEVVTTIGEFILYYKYFFISVVILILGFVLSVLYIGDVAQKERNFEVKIHEDGMEETLTDDQIKGKNLNAD